MNDDHDVLLARLRQASAKVKEGQEAVPERDRLVAALASMQCLPSEIAIAAGLSVSRVARIAAGQGIRRPAGRPRGSLESNQRKAEKERAKLLARLAELAGTATTE